MFKQLLEQGRTAAKVVTGMIPAKDVKDYMNILVDANVDFNIALAEAGTKYFDGLKGFAPKTK